MASGNPYTLKWGIMATGGIAESQYQSSLNNDNNERFWV